MHNVLRNVGVKFDINIAKNIMEAKPGYIANLLYEIRSNLEKKGVNPENISLKKSSHFQEMYAPMKFRQEIPQYDAFDSKHFYETLQRKTRAQKEVDLEKKLKKFEDFKIEQNKKIKQAIEEEKFHKEQEKAINIRNHRNKNQRYHAFLQQFEEKGINNWKNNMLRAKQREIKDVQFQLNEAQKIQKNLYRGIAKNIAIYHHEINQFEANFGKNGKKLDMKKGKKDENEKKGEVNESAIAQANISQQELENIPPGQASSNFGNVPHYQSVDTRAANIISGIHQKIMLDNRTKTERNRRRRKIIVEQGKAQLEIENKRREEQYIGKLAKQSNQEKQLTYETYRVNQCKNIIIENRNLREVMYTKRDESNKEFQKMNEENYLKFNIENFHRDQEKEENRKKDLEISQKQKQRSHNSEICKEMIDLIIDISDKAYEYQQINDVEEIDHRVWREWTNLFKNNQSVLNKQEENKDKEMPQEKEQEENKEENVKEEEVNEENKENKEIKEGEDQEEKKPEQDKEKEKEEESIHIDINSRYNKTFYSIFNTGDTTCTKLDQILDENEFYEYQNNKGQWNPELIPETAFITLKPDDLTFNYTPPANPQETNKKEKGGKNVNPGKNANDKAKPENIEEMMKLEDPKDLVIPKENIKNCYFGDLIGILIDLKYEEEKKKYLEERNSQKNLFRYIPIKIALIGKDFSGKRTQAKILSENFPLKIYDLGQLVKDAINLLSSKRETTTTNKFLLTNSLKSKTQQKDSTPQLPSDNNNTPAQNANNQNQITNEANKTQGEQLTNTVAQMRNEQAAEEVKYAKIKELAREIKLRLGEGEGVPDEIYAELLCEYIKLDFPPKEDDEVNNEIIERVSRKEKVLEEIEKNKEENIKRPKTFERKDKELNDELMKISLEASKGFVIVNFPNTYNQAKLLENILSGYIPKSETRPLKSLRMKNLFSIVLDTSEEILPPNKLILGGFDFIFYINVPSNECTRRAVGRRLYYDAKNKENIIYHLEDKLPPTDSNICENLKKVGNIDRCESALVTRHLSFENSVNEVISFYQPFGFENKHLQSFEEINGNQEKDYVTQNILTYINQLVELNEEHDQEIYEKHENESIEEDDEGEDEQNITDNLLEGNSALEEKKGPNDLLENNEVLNSAEKQNDSEIIANEDGGNNIEEGVIANNKLQEEEENKPLDKYEEYCQKIQKIKDSLNRDLADILLKIWSNLFQNYVCECKSIFKFLRVQRDSISVNYNLICQKFIEFLKRPSKKQILLLDYQMKYNKFLDDYPDLKDDPQVKEEHHQEVDDLNDKIYEIIETRKNEAVEERKKIMTSGWIENEMEKFYMALERLFQNEIDKFIGSLQIMRDYYHNLDNRPLIELPFSTIDIIKEEIDQTPIEEFNVEGEENTISQQENKDNKENKDNAQTNPEANVKETLEQYIEKNMPKSYPRVEKLYKNSLKIQFQYEEALREAERAKSEKEKEEAKKNAAPGKGKKAPDKGKENVEEAAKEEVYPHNDELKQAISNEKSKFKYKLTLLKYWGISCLKNFRRLSLTVYNKLEDWIILAIKAENEALNELTVILKENIESESKIKYELALETFDVIVNMDVQNYIELPPKPLPAKEVIDHNKFNIVQLKILMEELQTYLVENTSSIRSSTFISIFLKKYISSKNDNDVYYGIPNLLKNLSFYNYFKFIKKLDPENTDLISLKHIGTFFSLLSDVIPTKNEINQIKEQAKKLSGDDYPLLNMNQFTQIEFWFDENERSPTLKNHEDYHRDIKLKEILFDINKNINQSQGQEENEGESVIDFDEFITILNLECITAEPEKYQGKTYYDALFF